MAEKKIKWTDQQQRAITQRKGDVLVTASAGTGKTAVLSGRCVDIVSDKCDVRNILVLTFTDAAAEQMRWRIAEQLKTAFLEGRDRRLGHQLILLQAADISTIHSFCKRLITNFFYELGLDPTFRLIDADEQKLLKAQVLSDTIDWAWQQSNLRQVLPELLSRRDLRTNDGFLTKIITLSDFLDSVTSREKWCQRALVLAKSVNPITTPLGEKQKEIVAEKLRRILNQIEHAIMLYENHNAGGDWSIKWQEAFVEPVLKSIRLLEDGNWPGCAKEIINFQKPPKLNYKPDIPDGPIADIIRKTAKAAKEDLEKLSELAILNPDYLDTVGGSTERQTKVLIRLVRQFDRLYSQAKRAANCLDFADLEHHALRLLTEENGTDEKPLPSQTALALRRRYEYIFVDEYQDINPVQKAILDMLSSDGNIFVVGDIKQSIYAWRGAEPQIFLKYLESASTDLTDRPKPLRVDLNTNFRSAGGILDFVNKVFSRIMTTSLSKIDYDDSAKLKPALANKSKDKTQDNEPVVELHILDEQSSESIESGNNENLSLVSSRQRQAAMIAQRIKQIVAAGLQIYDKRQDKFRAVQYRDIVILMRSLIGRANDYVEVLRLAGVPVSCQAIAGYFETTEISDSLCLLKVLDNPQRDIELAAVLRSPLFSITDTELTQIKVHSKKNTDNRSFYDCLAQYCDNGPDDKLTAKLKEILAAIEKWRSLARRGSLADLIWRIYSETGFLAFVSALPNGQQRRANLLKLHDRAIQFEGFATSTASVSLTRFVEFIEKLCEAGQDWSPAEPGSSAENAVRIISIHKSKGLEFPVVFLAELDAKFNKRDVRNDCLVDINNTLGLQIIDRHSNSKLSSLAHQVIAEQKLSDGLAEEMRILYVATTRARERLILSACKKTNNCRNIICDSIFLGAEPITDWQLRSCQSPLEWLLHGLSDQQNLHNAFETGFSQQCRDDGLFTLKLYKQTELQQLSRYIRKLRNGKSQSAVTTGKSQPKPTSPKLLSRIKRSLAWRYRLADVALLPAKQSVTQMTHRNDEYVKVDYSAALKRKPAAVLNAEADLLCPAQLIGTATHLVIAHLDLTKPVTAEAVEKTKQELLGSNAITETVAEHINTSSIVAFFKSTLGQAALETNHTVRREWPFTFAVPASKWQHNTQARPERGRRNAVCNTNDETIIIQGIIDMLIQTPQGLLVIDFKTDNISAKQAVERSKLYREQLELYGMAAGAILGTSLAGRWLYFLTPRCAVET